MKNKPATSNDLLGEYNEYGYSISTLGGESIHMSGNHKYDSNVYVSPASESALSVKQIKRMCIKTGREIAKERKVRFMDWQYIEAEKGTA